MKVGIIGFSLSGKSTLYRAAARGQAKGDVTAVPVPDSRFDQIVAQVQPKKATPASIILHDDVPAIEAGARKTLSQRFLDQARNVDVLLHVVRAFDSPVAPYHDSIDPIRDMETVDVELVLSDLAIMETRLVRLNKMQQSRQPGSPEYTEQALFSRLKPALEDGVPLRDQELSEEEAKTCRNYQFLSAKQTVVAFNIDEGSVADGRADLNDKVVELRGKGTQAFQVCATIEEEIAQLSPEDQPEFLESLGLSEPASAKVVRAIYDALGLITFFTSNENETRAWPLREGSSAVKAAHTIHSDIARGFIRAEVTHFDEYVEAGSVDAANKAGRMKLEGKEYVVQDGDLVRIRHKT